MQTISYLLRRNSAQQKASESTNCSDQARLEYLDIATKIFDRLKTARPSLFLRDYPTAESVTAAVRLWASTFHREQISHELLRIALFKAETQSAYLPDLREFLQLCEPVPEEHGFPSLKDAYSHAVRQSHHATRSEWAHKAVFHAAKVVGGYELKNAPESDTRRKFEAAYLDVVKRMMSGEQFSDIPIMIECDKYGERVKSAPAKLKNLMEGL